MKTKSKYPPWFSYYSKPYLMDDTFKPKEFYVEHKVIEELGNTEIETNEEFEGQKVFIEAELDSSDCYYESDTPSIKLQKFIKIEKPNPHYKSELKRFEKQKEDAKLKRKEWNKWKKIYEEDKKIEREASELAQLEKLKQKYEQNNRDSQT